MPAQSKSQQRFFGVVKAMQKGDIPKKGKAGKIAKDPNNPNRYSDNILPADSEGNIYYSSDRANAILEGGILLDDELLDHWDLGPPVNGKVVTIMNSAGYYDYSWREPADIDWAVIQDIGWTAREVWRRTRGFVVTSINIITFFILWELLTIY